MMGIYFLVATLLLSIKSTASDQLKPCNVKRAGKAPLFAKDCTDLGDGYYLVTPCSSNLNSCKTKNENVVGGNGCETTSPSTPTPKEAVSILIKTIAPKYKASIIDLSDINIAKPHQIVNGHFYFAKIRSEIFEVANFSQSFKVVIGKTSVSPHFASVDSFEKANFGWQAFKVQGNELEMISLSSVVPDCDSSSKK